MTGETKRYLVSAKQGDKADKPQDNKGKQRWQKKGKKKLFLFGIVFAVLGVLGLLTSFGGVFAKFPWLTVGLPAITSFYFDWFSGCIQAFIFCTLTTIFIKQAAG